jgi:diketogulonate reductase-like aldo/keto reductase
MVIGRAIQTIGIDRHELILSDKVWNTSRGHDAVVEACKASLRKLKTEYLDLYLIHWPASPKVHENWVEINADTWSGMEKLYRDGYVRAIGVCNFKMHHLAELKKTAEISPMIDQFEFHPGMLQREDYDYCMTNGIQAEASSPLGNGKILQNRLLRDIAAGKGKSIAQVCLRWSLQKGSIVIPKTVSGQRLRENMDIFDFELSAEEIEAINQIPYSGGIGIDSDEVTEFG